MELEGLCNLCVEMQDLVGEDLRPMHIDTGRNWSLFVWRWCPVPQHVDVTCTMAFVLSQAAKAPHQSTEG
jgi:hypothetical protein